MVRYRNNAIEKTEKRISLMGEIIRCIRIIKINCLEESFSKKIERKLSYSFVGYRPILLHLIGLIFLEMRHAEKLDIRTAGYAQSLAIACGPVVPVVAAILTFLGVVLSGNDLLASDVSEPLFICFGSAFKIKFTLQAFSAITVFFVMLFGIRMIPYGSRYLAEAIVAVRRIQEILLVCFPLWNM